MSTIDLHSAIERQLQMKCLYSEKITSPNILAGGPNRVDSRHSRHHHDAPFCLPYLEIELIELGNLLAVDAALLACQFAAEHAQCDSYTTKRLPTLLSSSAAAMRLRGQSQFRLDDTTRARALELANNQGWEIYSK